MRQFGQMIAPLIDGVFLDLRLPADDGVGPEPRAGLDEHALVDEAGTFDSGAVFDPRVGAIHVARRGECRETARPHSARP